MTEDILFDNIYVGHSVDDAKTLASQTFDIKKPLEEEKEKAAAPEPVADEKDETTVTWTSDPLGFIRQKVFVFLELAKVDPVLAFKRQPETAGALVVALLTVLGMLGSVLGVIGQNTKPVAKSSKKTDAPSADDKKKTEVAPVAPAGGDKSSEGGVKKRK